MSATTAPAPTKDRPWLAWLQKLGRSLMLPIAALPVAGLMLRLGSADMLGSDGLGWDAVASVIGAAGGALFSYLPLLFAVGVAIGLAKKADGSTGLAALVGYIVFEAVEKAMSPLLFPAAEGEKQTMVNFGVFGGILCGVIAAYLWQRYRRTKLPTYLAFFGGRRFVPIITSFATMLLGVAMSFIYPAFNCVLVRLGEWAAGNDILGGFIFGTVNRLLIPLGLHHILNTTVWFQVGSCVDAEGAPAAGDLGCFFATAGEQGGLFMTGFFPIMMFALPAAAIAIWRNARVANRKLVGGLMLSAALTAFLTGITEPLEFAFMFVAFPLYIVHALLTGSSLALVNALGIRDGFTFSAGLFDYLINFRIATQPLLLLLIGLGYAVVYYLIFTALIKWWNLKTPGREDDGSESAAASLIDTGEDAPERPQRAAEVTPDTA